MSDFIHDNVNRIRKQISDSIAASARSADAVRIIAVTKTVAASALPSLLDSGMIDAAENRWQVAREKFEHPCAKEFTWHFIGSLQTNKLKYVVPQFDWVHSVDRLSLAQAISEEAGKRARHINLLVQVNMSEEPQKHGVTPKEALPLLKEIAVLPHVTVRGLMTMAQKADNVQATRPVFRGLGDLFESCKNELSLESFEELSMGMSDDFMIAVEEGSTMVRIGRRLVQDVHEGKG